MPQDLGGDPRVGPALEVGDELGVDREPRRQLEAVRLRGGAQPLDLGPRRLRVDVVDRHRRDAAPVVDPGLEQPREVVVGEVRRHLQVHVGGEELACGARRPDQLVERRLRMLGHPRARLGAEVLDDHLLDVAVALVQRRDRLQGLQPLLARLADPDQDPGRERHGQLAGQPDRLQPRLGELVRRAVVRPALLHEPQRGGFQHQSHRRRHRPQQLEVLPRHHPGVEVGEEPGLGEDELGHARQVLDRRLAAERGQLLARGPVAELGLVAEREERLVAARLGAGARDGEHLVGGHVRALAAARRLRERAVVADVAAELRQRDEDLRGVRDDAGHARGEEELVVLGPVDVERERGVVHDHRLEPGGTRLGHGRLHGDAEARAEAVHRRERERVDAAVARGRERERPGGPGERVERLGA